MKGFHKPNISKNLGRTKEKLLRKVKADDATSDAQIGNSTRLALICIATHHMCAEQSRSASSANQNTFDVLGEALC
jgi:hypothetical protein